MKNHIHNKGLSEELRRLSRDENQEISRLNNHSALGYLKAYYKIRKKYIYLRFIARNKLYNNHLELTIE